MPLEPYKQLGAKAVVFILDNISYPALNGAYLPFTSGFEPLPALFVDRDTGAKLRPQAQAGRQARLVLTAKRKETKTSGVTAVLPGRSEETIILNTHTDGQNFAEENGGVAFLHLARHFASLPRKRRLRRTLVFAAWPGHMYGELPETEGWIHDHPRLVDRAVAALTVEHLGCSEWVDSADGGYHATGEPEPFGVYTSEGKMSELAREGVVETRPQAERAPATPAAVRRRRRVRSEGIPQIGAIAGPTYLVTISPNGEMDKLNAPLASRQIAWIADFVRRIDRLSRAELRA